MVVPPVCMNSRFSCPRIIPPSLGTSVFVIEHVVPPAAIVMFAVIVEFTTVGHLTRSLYRIVAVPPVAPTVLMFWSKVKVIVFPAIATSVMFTCRMGIG